VNATLELGALFIFSSSGADPSSGFDLSSGIDPCCSEVRARNPLLDVVEAVEEIVEDVLETEDALDTVEVSEVTEDVIVVCVFVDKV